MRRSVVGDAGVYEGVVDVDKGIGDNGIVVSPSVASFAGDDVSIRADPVDGDLGAFGVMVPGWLALNLEGIKVTLPLDCRSDLAEC